MSALSSSSSLSTTSFVVRVFAIVSCISFLATATCPAALASAKAGCAAQNAGSSVCTIGYFGTSAALATNNLERLGNCLADGSDCCDDPCYAHKSADACAADVKCIGGGYSQVFLCVTRAKVCVVLTTNATACEATFFCKMVEGQCTFAPPAPSSAGPSSTADCPALHPFPIAMIVLIFITFVASIIIVGVTLVIVRKRAEREEQEEEEKNAEAAIAAFRKGGIHSNSARMNNGDRSSVATGSNHSPSPPRDYSAPMASPPHAEPADDGYGYSQQSYGNTAANTHSPSSPAAAAAAPAAADDDDFGQYDQPADGGEAAFEIQYDEYGGYYAADGTYYDAQGNAYGADGQPIGGAEQTFGEDDY